MTAILVLGGYGGFGGRISNRLAQNGHHVIVAGRNLGRAQRFCAGRSGMVPLALDRETGLAAALAMHRPAVLVDAAGPFQGLDYGVPRACIAAGCHYIDIADGRDFVIGIAVLDAEARAAGVCVIAGASTVPALSGAVARHLAEGLDRVCAVEIAISASNKATAGPSVAEAIVSYVGKPVPLWRAGRWETGFGWQALRRQRYSQNGGLDLGLRVVALADVPDLDLLPGRLPGQPATRFQAGTELAPEMVALWLLSWPVRWGWIGSLRPLMSLLLRLKGLTRWFGTDRSAMIVRLFGTPSDPLAGDHPSDVTSPASRNTGAYEHRWTLIATKGAGPDIPCLAAPLLVERLERGLLEPGARDAGLELTLADFDPALSTLSVRHTVDRFPLAPPLFARVLGPAFLDLPPAVQRLHDVVRDGGASGRASVTRGHNPIARLVAAILGLPMEGDHALHVGFEERHGVEIWRRDFGGRRFSSVLSQQGRWLVERFGALRFGFDVPLTLSPPGLSLRLERWWIGPIPMPMALAPKVSASEWEADGSFHFDVSIGLPLVGLVVGYRGFLDG